MLQHSFNSANNEPAIFSKLVQIPFGNLFKVKCKIGYNDTNVADSALYYLTWDIDNQPLGMFGVQGDTANTSTLPQIYEGNEIDLRLKNISNLIQFQVIDANDNKVAVSNTSPPNLQGDLLINLSFYAEE